MQKNSYCQIETDTQSKVIFDENHYSDTVTIHWAPTLHIPGFASLPGSKHQAERHVEFMKDTSIAPYDIKQNN
jgi:hypothetical protein